MESYFHKNEIDEIKTRLSSFEIKKIENKIKNLSDESKRRVYQIYYNRKVRVGKTIFLLLLIFYVIFLIFKIPTQINNNKLDSNLLNLSKNNIVDSFGDNIVLLVESEPFKSFFYQDSLGYFKLTDKNDSLFLKVNTNILFLTHDGHFVSSNLVKSTDTIILLKDTTNTLFFDSKQLFKAKLENQVVQLSLQPNHILIGVKDKKSNLEFYFYSLGIFLIIGTLLYLYFMFIGICIKNSYRFKCDTNTDGNGSRADENIQVNS